MFRCYVPLPSIMRWFILDNLSSRFKEGERRGVRFGKRERKERRSKKNRLRLYDRYSYFYVYIYTYPCFQCDLFFHASRKIEEQKMQLACLKKERVDIFREFMNAKKKRESCYSLFSLQHSSQTFSPISLCVYTWLIYPRFHCDLFFRGEKSIEE